MTITKRLDDCKEDKFIYKSEAAKKQVVIDSLVNIMIRQQEAKSEIFRGMVEWQDSVKRVLKTTGL